MPDATLTIRDDQPIGTISPRLYGHFAEHLGRCCYDGVWVGPDAPIPHEGGFRRDVVAALRELPVPLLRWPGGCYADHYHWRDGIGPPPDRPRRLGMSCGLQVLDDNGLGTHEFLRLCALLGQGQAFRTHQRVIGWKNEVGRVRVFVCHVQEDRAANGVNAVQLMEDSIGQDLRVTFFRGTGSRA